LADTENLFLYLRVKQNHPVAVTEERKRKGIGLECFWEKWQKLLFQRGTRKRGSLPLTRSGRKGPRDFAPGGGPRGFQNRSKEMKGLAAPYDMKRFKDEMASKKVKILPCQGGQNRGPARGGGRGGGLKHVGGREQTFGMGKFEKRASKGFAAGAGTTLGT